MQLPNAENAIVSIEKLRDYALDPLHSRGRHKARVFAAVLGVERRDASALREAILDAILTEHAVPSSADLHGSRYVVDFAWTWRDRRATVRTLWIVRAGEVAPRLTSCFVKR